jgi:uncharacterized protein YeaO (DUF488 family)
MNISLKRIYDKPSRTDGARILVDRLWPRGISKEKSKLTEWLKDIAPTTGLRKWFSHDPKKWMEFQKRYKKELAENTEAVQRLKQLAKKKKVTLLYGAKDEEHNEAIVIKTFIMKD